MAVAVPVLATSAGDVPTASAAKRLDFNRDVRPIFSDNCFFCHGPDKNHRKAGLRLDVREGLFGPIEGRRPVVPGKPQESEIARRVSSTDEDEVMPPPKSNKKLTAAQVTTIKQWIEQGAEWKGHWAYSPVIRPAVPDGASSSFVRNPIDRFILARLSEAGLQPKPEADRATLCRRVYLDLLGLPPTPQQVDGFVSDPDPKAYEKLVEQLLANPHHGERMAIVWLDLARYADSIGYHSDNPMEVWPYRDWVINAFNRNEHFDQFTIEQLAGDLLPNATTQQRVASTYNRLLQTTEEGGAQPKEYRAKYSSDRVRNVAAGWLASTMNCCECHDHKFDPFTTRDFYSMAAFFADIQEADVGRREQGMAVPTPLQEAQLKQLDTAIAAAQRKIDAPEAALAAQLAAAQAEWETKLGSEAAASEGWVTLEPIELTAGRGTTLTRQDDGSILAGGKSNAKDNYGFVAVTPAKGITGIRLEVLPDASAKANGPGRAENGNFVLTEFKVSVGKALPADHDAAKRDVSEVRKSAVAVSFTAATADFSQEDYPIAHAIDGNGATGWAILPQTGKPHAAVFLPAEPIAAAADATLLITLEHQSGFANHNLVRFRLSVTTNPNPALIAPIPQEVRKIAATPAEQRTDKQRAELAAYYRTIAPALEPLRGELAKLQQAKAKLQQGLPHVLATTALPEPRVVRILARGNWLDETGEIVQPDTPKPLPPLGVSGRRATRLDLARWLVSRQNPLTARVFVNRLWRMYFGTGLSKTLEDVGSQGEWPTHPELLDWLAAEFMESGWDVRHMIRLMVTSGTYRQSSIPARLDVERDPFNRLYAHQSRPRLDAEIVRDNALAISGLLVDTIGGPSVKPYQPPGYWDYLNFPKRTWESDHGERQYRRGLYTHWQRTFLQPSLLAFDAPSREECVAQRSTSNTPQQALVLLNDPTYVEAARVFAERIVSDGGSTFGDRLNWAYRRALARLPQAQEAAVLGELFEKHRQQYAAQPEAAQALIRAGEAPPASGIDAPELAAWTNVSRAILNLHETITRN